MVCGPEEVRTYADRRDTWEIFLGFMSVVWGAVRPGSVIFIIWCYERAPYKFPADAWWSWVILFFVDDLAYYIFHR